MLDLRLFAEETLDITMPDGMILHVQKPTEKIVIEMLRLRGINEETDPETLLTAMNKMALLILRNNEEGIVISAEQVAALPLAAKEAILNEYTTIVSKIAADPTSSSRTTRAAGAKKAR